MKNLEFLINPIKGAIARKIFFAVIILILVSSFSFALDKVPSQQISENESIELLNNTIIADEEFKIKTVAEIASIYQIDKLDYANKLGQFYGQTIKPKISFQLLYESYAVMPKDAQAIARSLQISQRIENLELKNSNDTGNFYHIFLITLLLLTMYIIGRVFSNKKILTVKKHKKLWNALLLASFIASGVLGMMLAFRVNSGTTSPMRFDVLFWHVEIGIAMFAISVFHVIERWYYFKRFFVSTKRSPRKKKKAISTAL